jgi:uncharacterized protein (TIGR04255 family)
MTDVTFARPPINEVGIGEVFVPRQDLLVPHFGRFWERIREKYPGCGHAAPVVLAPGPVVIDQASGAPLPRVWFLTPDGSQLVQLQQDRIHVNWRATTPQSEYVRFPAIREEFERVSKLFDEFLVEETKQERVLRRFELTYINIIPQGQGWHSYGELGKVFRDFKWTGRNRFLPSPNRVAMRIEFSLPDNYGTLAVAINPARLVEGNADVIQMEITATSGSAPSASRQDWLDVAHHWVVEGFKDLTTPSMHKDVWQLV